MRTAGILVLSPLDPEKKVFEVPGSEVKGLGCQWIFLFVSGVQEHFVFQVVARFLSVVWGWPLILWIAVIERLKVEVGLLFLRFVEVLFWLEVAAEAFPGSRLPSMLLEGT